MATITPRRVGPFLTGSTADTKVAEEVDMEGWDK